MLSKSRPTGYSFREKERERPGRKSGADLKDWKVLSKDHILTGATKRLA